MSAKHPIIAITGSSGAGTTTVKTTFQQIFRREEIDPVIVEGDAFHRYDRLQMRAKLADESKAGNNHFSHFGPEGNLFEELESLFKMYSESGTAKIRRYLHDDVEAAPYNQEPGTFTEWEDIPPGTDMLFYEGLHGAIVTEKVDVARYADLLVGVVPRSTSNGFKSCNATRRRAVIRKKTSSTRSCDGCPITSNTSARNSPKRMSISSAFRSSIRPTRSSLARFRHSTRACS